MYDWSNLVRICNEISGKLDIVTSQLTILTDYLQGVLTPILHLICFAFFLKIGFTCLRGYKV